jgi:MoaD family protein
MKLYIEFTKPFSDAVGLRNVEVEFDGTNVGHLLSFLTEEYPKLKNELYTDAGELTDYVILFVNDKPISALEELETKVMDGDKIMLFFPVSGG